jgi:hypothetical protein
VVVVRLLLRARGKSGEAHKGEGEEKARKHHGGSYVTLIRCLPAMGASNGARRPRGKGKPRALLAWGPPSPP